MVSCPLEKIDQLQEQRWSQMRQVNSNQEVLLGLMGLPGEDSGQPGCSVTAEELLGGGMFPCS